MEVLGPVATLYSGAMDGQDSWSNCQKDKMSDTSWGSVTSPHSDPGKLLVEAQFPEQLIAAFAKVRTPCPAFTLSET